MSVWCVWRGVVLAYLDRDLLGVLEIVQVDLDVLLLLEHPLLWPTRRGTCLS